MADLNADAPWGVRHRINGVWRGCAGPEAISHQAARFLADQQPLLYAAERNPADVLAAELTEIDDEKIVARAKG